MPQALQVLPPPDQKPYLLEGETLLEKAKALQITDEASYLYAHEVGKEIAAGIKRINDAFEPSKKSANQAHKEICALNTLAIGGRVQAKEIIDGKLGIYYAAQEAKRRAEQARLEAEAKKRADEAALQAAGELEAAGDHETAAAMLNEALAAPAPVIDVPQPKIAGVSMRRTWTWRLKDAEKVNRPYLMTDDVKIGKLVRALGPDAAGIVGGIEVVEEYGTARRTS